MDKIIPNKIFKLSNDKCGKCLEEIDLICIKCDSCNEFFHHDCTKMPLYMCIKYLTTRITYTCENCVNQKTIGCSELMHLLKSSCVVTDETHIEKTSLNDLMKAVNKLNSRVDQLTTEPRTKSSYKSYSSAVKSNIPPRFNVIIKSKQGCKMDKQIVANALSEVPVLRLTEMQSGNIKLTLPDENTACTAISNIGKSTGHSASAIPLLQPKLTIASVDNHIDDKDVVDEIKRKNSSLSNLIQNESDAKIIFSKKSGEHTKTVVLSVTPQIRDEIVQNGFVYIGLRRCRVFDRFWVTRCYNCFGFNHKSNECRNTVKCGNCAGDHSSSDCSSKESKKCINCQKAGRPDTAHSAFSLLCPSFIAAKKRIAQRTATSKNCLSQIEPPISREVTVNN